MAAAALDVSVVAQIRHGVAVPAPGDKYVVAVKLVLTSCVALALTPLAVSGQQGQEKLRVNATRIQENIQELAQFGRTPHGAHRVAFSKADIEGRAFVQGLMREAGLEVHIDFAGNLIGRRKGTEESLPPIVFGSHIDTVPRGGNYDGCVGSIGAIECVRVLQENGIKTRHPLEVIIFADEEGGLVGSRALIGKLSKKALTTMTHSGRPIGLGIKRVGGDPTRLKEVVRRPGDIKAFLELHIEQGAVLHKEKVDIGVVEGIVGIKWWDVTVDGKANHAGTTPMDQRQDALLAAARCVIAVNETVNGEPGRQVGTVGKIAAEPGAHNVIPGRVRTSLGIRDLSAAKIDRLFQKIKACTDAIAKRSNTKFTFELLDVTATPALTDERVRACVEASARTLGLSRKLMPSGAGHDAQDMAMLGPTGMIFVPSVDGISHSPKEFTKAADMANGANVLLHTILRIARGGLDGR